MKAAWTKLMAMFEALSRRERWMVLIGLLALVVAVMNAVLVEPVARRSRQMEQAIAMDRAQIHPIKLQLQVLDSTPIIDPDAATRQHLEELRTKLDQANARLSAMESRLVPPERMSGLLEDILKRNGQLQLVSLKTLPVVGAATGKPAEKNAGATNASDVPVYRHGVELTVRGRYLDLSQYLSSLEKLPWHMLWGKAALVADAYPNSTLTLTIYTFSLDQAWLSL